LNLRKKNSRILSYFIIASFIISLILHTSEPYTVIASISQQDPISLALEQIQYSSSNRIKNHLDEVSEGSQKYYSKSLEPSKEEIKTVTIVDYAEPTSPARLEAPFSTLSVDPCGEGSNQFATESGGVRWRTFPVTYAVDTTNSGVDINAARNAIIQTFEELDKYIPGDAFNLISDFNSAKIKFRWQLIDGQFGQAGFASFSFTTPGLVLTSATITLDSGENWFVSPVHRCNSIGSSLDLQNVAAHELGHAVGLGHVTDNLLTMYPTSFAGETLKRSLGNGDRAGMNFLYPAGNTWASSWTSLGGGLRDNTKLVGIKNDDGRLQVFVVGTNNQLYYKTQTAAGSSTWTGWTSLGGGIKADTSPAVARNSDGRLQVFVVGTNNQLYYKTQTVAGSNTWSSSWTSIGGGPRDGTDPEVIADSDGRLQAFVVGTNNQLYYKTQISADSNTWSSFWTSLGGVTKPDTSPAVAMNDDGKLQAFVVGTNNQLYYKTQTSAGSSTWSSSWTSIGGGLRDGTDPEVVANSDGRLQAFVVGTNNQLYYKTQISVGSSTWDSLWSSLIGGARINSDPMAIANLDGRLQVFVVGTNNQLYYKTQTSAGSSTWSSSWTSLGGGIKTDTNPASELNLDNILQVFVVGTNNQLYYKWQLAPGA
jgi:predicted Zn-dependent protease